jgi:hypothetical protein
LSEQLAERHEVEASAAPDAAFAAELPFWSGVRLVALRYGGRSGDLFVCIRDGTLLPDGVLDSTNRPVYATNELIPPNLSPPALQLYVRFFFHFVRGTLGAFDIVETPDAINWLPDAPAAVREQVNDLLLPLTFLGQDPSGLLRLTGIVMFRNALFRTNILVATRADEGDEKHPASRELGELELADESLLMEDLPVVVAEQPDEEPEQ